MHFSTVAPYSNYPQASENLDCDCQEGIENLALSLERPSTPSLEQRTSVGHSNERQFTPISLHDPMLSPIAFRLMFSAAQHFQIVLHLQKQGAPWAFVGRCHYFADSLNHIASRSFFHETHKICCGFRNQNSGDPKIQSILTNISKAFNELREIINATHIFLNREREMKCAPEILIFNIDKANIKLNESLGYINQTLALFNSIKT